MQKSKEQESTAGRVVFCSHLCFFLQVFTEQFDIDRNAKFGVQSLILAGINRFRITSRTE